MRTGRISEEEVGQGGAGAGSVTRRTKDRSENVLAAAECSAPDIAEGILLDRENHVIEGTRSNLFWVQNGKLYTSDLAQCGVAGLQRDRVIEYAQQQGWACEIGNFKLSELFAADEIFVVNSLIGLWPVREMQGYSRTNFPVSLQIQEWLNNGSN